MKFSPVKVKHILKEQDRPQRWLADKSGLHENTVSLLLSDEEPTDKIMLYTVNRIAAALGVNTIDITIAANGAHDAST
jgi:DNA-binding Xre family transcriptional regulator